MPSPRSRSLRYALVAAFALVAISPQAAVATDVVDRDAYSTTVELGNGQLRTSLSSEPVNYQTDSGAWQPIDTALATDSDGTIHAKSVDGDVTVPKSLAEPLAFSRDGHDVTVRLRGSSDDLDSVQGATAEFDDALRGVDATYAATPDGIKETLNLASASTPQTFSYDVRAATDWSASVDSAGSVVLVDASGTERYKIAAPLAWDSAPDPSFSNALHLSVEKVTGGRWIVTLTPDHDWLTDPQRVYPISIDPDFSWSGGTTHFHGATDCYLSSLDQANYSFCAAAYLQTGYYNRAYKSLFKFDIASAIPANATVSSATFKAYAPPASVKASGLHSLYTVTSDWDSTATWNNRKTGVAWTTAGGDVSTNAAYKSASVAVAANPAWYSWTAPLSTVQKWVNGTLPNYGFLLQTEAGAPSGNAYVFASTEASTSSQFPASSNEWPTLDVTWSTPSGDTTPPAAPGAATAANVTASGLPVSWPASADPSPGTGTASYRVSWDINHADTWSTPTLVTATNKTIPGVIADDFVSVRISAIDGAGNESATTQTELTAGPVSADPCYPASGTLPTDCTDENDQTGDEWEQDEDLTLVPAPAGTDAQAQAATASAPVAATRYDLQSSAEECKKHRCWTTTRPKPLSWATGEVRVNSNLAGADPKLTVVTRFLRYVDTNGWGFGSFSWTTNCGWIKAHAGQDPRDSTGTLCDVSKRLVQPEQFQAKAYGGFRTQTLPGGTTKKNAIRGNNCYGTVGQYVRPSANGCPHGSAIFLTGPTVECADVGVLPNGSTRADCRPQDVIRNLDEQREWSGYCVNWRYVTKDHRWTMVRDNRSSNRGGWVFIRTSALNKDRSTWPGINDRKTCNYEADHDPNFPWTKNLALEPDDEQGGLVTFLQCAWFDPRDCNAVNTLPDGCKQCVTA